MLVRTPRDLGLVVRDARRRAQLTQAALAQLIGASRKWVIDLEAGKATAELGLVLNALRALDLLVDVQPGRSAAADDHMASRAARGAGGAPVIDLDAIVDGRLTSFQTTDETGQPTGGRPRHR